MMTAGCASKPGVLRHRGLHAAVLPVIPGPAARVRTPGGGTLRLIIGGPSALETIAIEAGHGLSDAGFRVLKPEIAGETLRRLRRQAKRDGKPLTAGALARGLDVDVVLAIRLLDWDHTALRSEGRMRIELSATLYDRAGKALWTGRSARKVSEIKLYRAKQDHRVHVRQAVNRILAGIP